MGFKEQDRIHQGGRGDTSRFALKREILPCGDRILKLPDKHILNMMGGTGMLAPVLVIKQLDMLLLKKEQHY